MNFKKVAEYSLWKINLLFFAFLFTSLYLTFYFHYKEVQKIFLGNMKRDALTVAEIIRLNTETGVLAEKIIRNVTNHFLMNIAYFIDYLNSIEPFSFDELYAFVQENGLAGAFLKMKDGNELEVPEEWLPSNFSCTNQLIYLEKVNLFIYCTTHVVSMKSIILAVKIKDLISFYEKASPKGILHRLENLPHIISVKLDSQKVNVAKVVIISDKVVVDVPFEDGTIHILFKADVLQHVEDKLKKRYFSLAFVIFIVGVFFTTFFYLFQKYYIYRIKHFELELSVRREEAALGRASAAIAHEIRNPLNTVSIALQRLLLEGKQFSEEEKYLLNLIRESLSRVNQSIEQLLKYSRIGKMIEKKDMVNLSSLINDLLLLYRSRLEEKEINLQCEHEEIGLLVNRDLFLQALENLILNAVESVEKKGILKIITKVEGNYAVLLIANSGKLPPQDKLEDLFLPYVTFKTSGTGLGLAVVKKIVEAHKGSIKADITQEGLFQIELRLPTREGI